MFNAPIGIINHLRLKLKNPSGSTNVNVTIDIFPDTTEITDIDNPSSAY